MFSLLLTVDRILAKYSPVTIIQRYFRGWLVRLRLARDSNYHIRQVLKYNSMRMDKPHTSLHQLARLKNVSILRVFPTKTKCQNGICILKKYS